MSISHSVWYFQCAVNYLDKRQAVTYNFRYMTNVGTAIKYRGQDMKIFSRFLAVATVIALGLAFSPEVSATHKIGHENVSPGLGPLPPGCNTSSEVRPPKKCKVE